MRRSPVRNSKTPHDFGVALAEGVIGLADDERSRLAGKHDRLGA